MSQVPIIAVDSLPGGAEGYCPWAADRIYVLDSLTPKRRAFIVAHESEHIRQAKRFSSPSAWQAAWLEANRRGYWHNRFEHKANLAAFAATR